MGFAVVADEVRSLAGRCGNAAREIGSSIEESVGKAQSGNLRLDEAAASVRDLSASALKVKELVEAVDRDAQQQSISIDQIAKALASIEQTTQGNAAMAEQSASASAELNSQASALDQVITSLEALI